MRNPPPFGDDSPTEREPAVNANMGGNFPLRGPVGPSRPIDAGRSPGPSRPIGPGGLAGPSRPLAPSHPLGAVGAGGPTAPSRPIGAGNKPPKPPEKARKRSLLIALAAVLLLLLLLIGSIAILGAQAPGSPLGNVSGGISGLVGRSSATDTAASGTTPTTGSAVPTPTSVIVSTQTAAAVSGATATAGPAATATAQASATASAGPTATSAPGAPIINVSPTSANANCVLGTYPQLTVRNNGGSDLHWSATTNEKLLMTVSPSTATLGPGDSQIVKLSGLLHLGASLIVTFTSNGGSATVTLTCN